MQNLKIGITGLPGAGKTSTLLKLIEELEQEGYVVGGMITEPILEKNKRIGFYIVNWLTKEKRVFAHIKKESKIKVGRYGVDIEVLATLGVESLKMALEKADIIVIDEIGKMEVESSQEFIDVVKEILDSEKPVILTLHKKSRNPLLQDIRRREDIRILEVTHINKNFLPFRIMKLLKGETL
jgi:nucleoside-triphosphatase